MGGSCGDGILDQGEDCEQGISCPGLGICNESACSCSTSLTCGDGIIQSPEECDDGPNNSDITPGSCRTNCEEARCGDFVIDFILGGQQEECDLGAGNSDISPNTCRKNCLAPRCGDAVIDNSEECDDGNIFDGDGCTIHCQLEDGFVSRCGNGRLELGEECDDNNRSSGDGCSNTCLLEGDSRRPGGSCGDGTVTVGEECDDNNTVSGDGCNSVCRVEITQVASADICGDGIVTTGEECDDGNRRDFDGCTTTCELETGFCGDGIIQELLGEQCEPALHSPDLPYGCGADCRNISIFCGDSNIDAGEQCDEGFNNSDNANASCRTNCSLAACGDGILDTFQEICDDGNRRAGDGCDRFCRPEVPSAPGLIPTQVSGQQYFANSQIPGQQIPGQLSQIPGQLLPFQYQQDAAGNPIAQLLPGQLTPLQQQQLQQQGFPTMANLQPLPYQLPLPRSTQGVPVGDTGPAALAVMAAGAAAGLGWTRKKKRK